MTSSKVEPRRLRRDSRRRLSGIVALATTAAFMTACGSDAEAGGDGDGPLVVGVNMSLTGPFAAIGESEMRGIELAVKEINADGGVDGRQIELKKLDDASDPARATTNVRQLISDGVVAILGPTTGSTTLGAYPFTERAKVLEIIGVGPDFTGDGTVPANVFTVPPPVEVWLDAAACYASEELGATDVAGLFTPDAAGSLSKEGFPDALDKYGVSLGTAEDVELTATDTSVQWTKIRDSNPDAVLDWATGAVGGLTLKDAKALAPDVPVIGYVSWGVPAVAGLAGPAGDGVTVVGHIAPDDPTEAQKPFVEAFKAEYPDATIDHYAAYGHDMVTMFAAAAAAVPGAEQGDGEKLSQALEDADTIEGVVGSYDFGDESEGLGAHSGVTVEDINYLTIKEGWFVRADPQPVGT